MVSLPILFHGDNTKVLEDCGIHVGIEQLDTRDMVFFKINALSPYYMDGKQMTAIHSNGDVFICPFSVESVVEMIQMTNENH